MPVVIMTGYPSSGKSYRTDQLRSYFKTEKNKTVQVVSENKILESSSAEKNDVFNNSIKEKTLRCQIMSELVRLVNPNHFIIIDAGNYIKGIRYELYCEIKNNKTTQCVIHCDLSVEKAWEWNCKRDEKEQYTRETFDALVMRYEHPDSRNRWDSPLYTILPDDPLPLEDLYKVLFERKPPPPNQSVFQNSAGPENYLPEMERIIQDICAAIVSAQKLGLEGDVKIPGYEECVSVSWGTKVTYHQLARHRRQFVIYVQLQQSHPDISKIGSLFIKYLNTNL